MFTKIDLDYFNYSFHHHRACRYLILALLFGEITYVNKVIKNVIHLQSL